MVLSWRRNPVALATTVKLWLVTSSSCAFLIPARRTIQPQYEPLLQRRIQQSQSQPIIVGSRRHYIPTTTQKGLLPDLAYMMDVDSIWPAVVSGVTIMGAFVAAQASIQDGVEKPHKEPSLGTIMDHEDCPEEAASNTKLEFRNEFLKRSGPKLTWRPIEVVESRMAAPNIKNSGGGANIMSPPTKQCVLVIPNKKFLKRTKPEIKQRPNREIKEDANMEDSGVAATVAQAQQHFPITKPKDEHDTKEQDATITTAFKDVQKSLCKEVSFSVPQEEMWVVPTASHHEISMRAATTKALEEAEAEATTMALQLACETAASSAAQQAASQNAASWAQVTATAAAREAASREAALRPPVMLSHQSEPPKETTLPSPKLVSKVKTCDDRMPVQNQMSWTGASWASENIVPSAVIAQAELKEEGLTKNREHVLEETSRRNALMVSTSMPKIEAQQEAQSTANEAVLEKAKAKKDVVEETRRRDALMAEATRMASVEAQKRAKSAANEAALEKAKYQATSLALQQATEKVAFQMAKKEASSQAVKMAKTTASEVATGWDRSKIDQLVQTTSHDRSQITDTHARAMETNLPVDRDTLPHLTRDKSDEAAHEAAHQKTIEVAQETSKAVADEAADVWSARHMESEKSQESSVVKDLTLNAVKDIKVTAHVANADGKAWDTETQGIAALERAIEYFAHKCALKTVSQKAEDIAKTDTDDVATALKH